MSGEEMMGFDRKDLVVCPQGLANSLIRPPRLHMRQAKSIALKEIRISRLKELELCMLNVGSTKDFKSPIRHEPSLALPSISSVPALEPAPVTPSLRVHESGLTMNFKLCLCLLLIPVNPSCHQLLNGAQQSQGPLQHTQSMSGLKDITESSNSRESFSNGTHPGEAMGNTSSGLFSYSRNVVLELLGHSLLRLIRYNRYKGMELNKIRTDIDTRKTRGEPERLWRRRGPPCSLMELLGKMPRKKRPTAQHCLQHPWLNHGTLNNGDHIEDMNMINH
ncbi:hypothetical protein Bca4012_009472 [Brassica carinata]|uniref:Uncharacterized protein n=1 Tax=Brassica carinata TaxID=52824 RepID=A0A8X7RZ97_BRACI|nr:hypothetical protein Bca52824_034740 [Brassica carinata]